jgi:hypothetical protein
VPPAAGLTVVQPVLHFRGESGGAISESYEYVGGELMYFSFRIAGYKVKNDRADLRWLIFASDPAGVLLWEPLSGQIQAEVTHHDENWLPEVRELLPLPPQLPPGSYHIKIRVADENAGTSVEHEVGFRVGGKPLPTTDKLSILDVRFYRSDQDPSPLPEPVYRPGDALWMRFGLAGFQLGEKNRFDVEYGLKVLRPSGKEMYSEPKAAAEQDAPYYPKRFLTGTLSLNLSADLTPGRYTIVVLARDNVANVPTEKAVEFVVEK